MLKQLIFVLLTTVTFMTGATETTSETGIAECDSYIQKYKVCLNTMPAEMAAASKSGLDMMVNGWKQSLDAGVDKSSLAVGCKMASDNSKASMEAMGCQW